MPTTTNIEIITPPDNPDLLARQRKSTIDISTTVTDVSSSNSGSNMLLNYQRDELVLYVDANPSSSSEPFVYYTPVYTEKLDYNVWKTTVNKSFQQLSLR